MKSIQIDFLDTKFTINIVTDGNEVVTICKKLMNEKWEVGGLDIETAKKEKFKDHKKAGLDPYLTDIRLVQLYDGLTTVWVFDVFKFPVSLLGNLLQQKKWVAHYAVFELLHLTHADIENLDVSCSMLMSQYITNAEYSPFEPEDDDEEPDGMSRYRRKDQSLEAVFKRNFNIILNKEYQLSDWSGELSSEQICYAAQDSIATFKIGELLWKKINDYKMAQSFILTKEMQHVVVEMQLEGFGVDVPKYAELIRMWKKLLNVKETACREQFGGINLNSTQQLNEWLKRERAEFLAYWPKNEKSGLFSFSKNKIFNFYKDPAVKVLLEYKKLSKLLSTYGESFLEKLHPVTGRIHCGFTLGDTRTGRMSSREPNLQNLVASEEVRSCFIPKEGNVFVVADYSQIEVRVLAELSGDKVLREGYKRGFDAYIMAAAHAFGKKPEDVTKEERKSQKAMVLGFQFGLGGEGYVKHAKIQADLDLTVEEGWNEFNRYHNTFMGVTNWKERQREYTRQLGFCRTPLGRMRKLLDDEIYTKSVNNPVQGGAGEVMQLGMVKYRNNRMMCSKLVNSVHDEIITECSENTAEQVCQEVVDNMTAAMSRIFPNAPVNKLVEAHIGKNWAEAKG